MPWSGVRQTISGPGMYALLEPSVVQQAVIVSRINKQGKVQFVAIVIDDYKGIRDCFGFNEISKFECNTIIERFYRGQRALDLNPELLKALCSKYEEQFGGNDDEI